MNDISKEAMRLLKEQIDAPGYDIEIAALRAIDRALSHGAKAEREAIVKYLRAFSALAGFQIAADRIERGDHIQGEGE